MIKNIVAGLLAMSGIHPDHLFGRSRAKPKLSEKEQAAGKQRAEAAQAKRDRRAAKLRKEHQQ